LALGLSLAHLQRVARVASRRDVDLARLLRATPVERRLSELALRGGHGWAGQLGHALIAMNGAADRVAHVNETLADLECRLDERVGWPVAALRISVAGAILACVPAVLAHRLNAVLIIVVLGAVGALGSIECARRARRLATAQRAVIDAVIDAASPALATGAMKTAVSVRRRHRSRSSRRS
jgi:hypothetical protein